MFVRTVLHDHIKLHARELGKNYRDVLLVKVRGSVEGKCTRHGYIVPNSVQLLGCSCGRLDGSSLNGDVVYEVEYQATVCNPPEKSVVQARVMNVNRFGILAHGGLTTVTEVAGERQLNVLEIIVAKQGVALASDVDLDKVKIGDDLQVQILGKRFELNDTKITVIGKVLSTTSHHHQQHATSADAQGHRATTMSSDVVSEHEDDDAIDIIVNDGDDDDETLRSSVEGGSASEAEEFLSDDGNEDTDLDVSDEEDADDDDLDADLDAEEEGGLEASDGEQEEDDDIGSISSRRSDV